jgi:F0F1-type ATP synthase membrane subunit c/vacuolar-type H+-ATPase subunit K
VTKWSDVLALNWWVNVRSTWGWAASIIVAAAITVDAMGPRLEAGGEDLPKRIAVSFVVFIAIMAAVWLLGLVGMLLVASANLLRKGAVGPKSFTISADALVEDDGYRTTAVPWRQVRSIDKTRRHILIRIGRWKFLQLAARDFQNEYQFAQYYADLVRAKHENT